MTTGRAAPGAGGRRPADHGQGGIERVHERLQHLEAGADAVDQEQRNSVVIPGPYRDAYLLTADVDVLNLHSKPYTRW